MNRKEFVIVGANKASFAKIENYSFRRLVAAKVSTQDLDIYGGMWDGLTRNIIGNRWELFKYAIKTRQSVSIINLNRGILRKYPSVKGPVKNKHLTLLDYKFNVIIENSPHYLTEKIIDSFLAGSIPVFCGPNLEFFGIPEDLVISINSDMTECEIKEKFDTIKGNEYSEKLLAIKDFVTRSEFVEKFSASAIMAKVLKVFESYIKSHED
jgi:hypothetical protein